MLHPFILEDSIRLCLIDAGNSTLKYQLCQLKAPDDKKYSSRYRVVDRQLAHAEDLPGLLARASGDTQFVVASVRAPSFLDPLRGRNVQCVRVPRSSKSLSLAYEKVDDLGVDRWLAMLAASALCGSDQANTLTLVIDSGTAVTADLIECSMHGPAKHLGGWILPGQGLQLTAINLTGRINLSDPITNQARAQIGNSTQSCVLSAIAHASDGFISSVIDYAHKRASDIRIIGSGGGMSLAKLQALAGRVQERLIERCSYRSELVFEGMEYALCHDEATFARL